MWWRILVLIYVVNSFYLVSGEKEQKVFDVTTIFDVSNLDGNEETGLTGRVHSRTNALGLPLINGYKLWNKFEKPNITCDSIQNICPWILKGWTLTTFPSSLPNYDYYNITKQSFLGVQKPFTYTLKRVGSNDWPFNFNILLSPETTHSDCTGYHDIKVTRVSNQKFTVAHRFCSCSTSGQFITYMNNRYGSRSRARFSCEYYDEYISSNSNLKIAVESGEISLWNKKSKVKKWIDSINVKYFYLKGDDSEIRSTLITQAGKAYKSRSEDSEMVSPVIILKEDNLCLALVFHIPSHFEGSVLDIFCEDLSAERSFLYSVKNVLPGWNIKHVNINITKTNAGPFKLVLKKTNNAEINLARISSCSCDGKQVETISLEKTNILQLAAENQYSVTAYGIEPAEEQDLNVTCMNGGVGTSGGCACPAGFYGSSCQSGCGRNRFGQDCRGLCTLRQRECQGLLMCTYSTGCHCAPGYQGPTCQQKCSNGYYGNNCQQRCGHCAGGDACDIYTGKCSSCEFGYLTPNCDKESVYYSLTPQLSAPEYGVIVVSFHPGKYITKLQAPVLYQIQYRVKPFEWKTYVTKKYPDLYHNVTAQLISESIVGLQAGVLYKVRVLLLDDDFNKYDGDLVETSEILTKCEIPEKYDYKLAYESDASSLKFSWTYILPVNSHWCPVEQYEVSWKEDWQWFTEYTDGEYFSLSDLLPGSSIQFRVRAKTVVGFSPFSDVITASTLLTGVSAVRNLKAESKTGSSVEVSWDPPIESDGKQLRYTILYRCVDRPACSPGCQTASEGQQSVQDTHVTLSPLLPFTQYKITVTPENGQPESLLVGTSDVVPTEVPKLSAQTPVRTNTSVTVFWEEVPVCSGFFLGYNYQLTKESESLKILESGFTNNNNATFHNLTASTQYIVKVFISTIAGWNPDSFLAINVSTSATVPEAVRNLTVYKRGRGMLGLRWTEPRATYSQLKSFTVTHSLGQEVVSHTVEPTRCVVWPDLYCYTIESLRSNRRYNVSVSARNSEIAEDGEMSFVSDVTKESPPSVPENLKVINMSTTSIELEWKYPDMANGIVRSFLIGIEETEKFDQDTCCQIYPFVETLVKEEFKTYTAEVSGLHPASTYFVSVSAKTVGLGPAQSLVVSTRPPHLALTSLPRVEPEVSWLPQERLPEVNNSDIYASLVRVNLLLAVINDNQSVQFSFKTDITDPKLDSLLQERIGKPFYFIGEYNQDDDVDLTAPLEDNDSPWGQPPALLSPEVSYQLAAVQVLEYNGVYNVDVRYTQPVIFPN